MQEAAFGRVATHSTVYYHRRHLCTHNEEHAACLINLVQANVTYANKQIMIEEDIKSRKDLAI